ncbi:MAG: acetate--CoA ligase family protein [Candidatus Dojkabacteria bacterium]
MGKLNSLFNPKSVAIVGVSEDPAKLGSVMLSNLNEGKYKGEIYPVNPKYKELFGYKCYPKVSSIKEDVDCAIIVIPAGVVPEILEDCGIKKVKTAIIISAGFKEVGPVGEELEKRISSIARKYNIRILGPNCLGAIVPKNKINMSFAASHPLEGDIAFVSQSGAFCTAILDMSLQRNVGFSHFVSFGNKIDLNENDFLEDWLEDDEVKVIGGYLEEVDSGLDLVEIYKETDAKKPFIVLKPGESVQAQKAISSHTGSLAGSTEVFQTAMSQAGITTVKDVNQMFNLMMGFSWSKLPQGKKVAIVTNAGGPGIIATDEVIKRGLEMAQISEESKIAMRDLLPPNASLNNPIDVIGDALAERYKAPIDVLMKDKNVDIILVVLTPQLVTQIEDTAKLIINSTKLGDKPIFAVFLGGKYVSFGLQRLYDDKIPAFNDIDQAVDVIAAMEKYSEFKDSLKGGKNLFNDLIDKNLEDGKYRKELLQVFEKSNGNEIALNEELTSKIAVEVGLDLPEYLALKIEKGTFEKFLEFAKGRYPLVLKTPADVIAHKTDKKAIYLNLKNDKELESAYNELIQTIEKEMSTQGGKIKTPSLILQEQIIGAKEVFIGVKRDGDADVYKGRKGGFGHLITFGTGGIYTEIYHDIAYSLVPSSEEEILESFKTTKIFKIIEGARGLPPLNLKAILKAIQAIQKLVIYYPEISSIDLNPVLLNEKRAVCVDLKFFVGK